MAAWNGDSSIPGVFNGRCLRSGIKYADLSEHYFTAAEKLWICVALVGAAGSSPQVLGRKISSLCKRYNLTKLVIKEWLLYHSLGIVLEPGYSDLVDYPIDARGITDLLQFQEDIPGLLESVEDKGKRWLVLFRNVQSNTAIRRQNAMEAERAKWN